MKTTFSNHVTATITRLTTHRFAKILSVGLLGVGGGYFIDLRYQTMYGTERGQNTLYLLVALSIAATVIICVELYALVQDNTRLFDIMDILILLIVGSVIGTFLFL